MKRFLLLPLLFTFIACGFGQSSPSNSKAVRVMATVQPAAPSITVQWNDFTNATNYTLYRRVQGTDPWGNSIASLPGNATSFVDSAVEIGIPYEYKVVRSGSAYGYMRSGIRVPEVGYRGKLILLVESGAGASLVNELNALQADLLADGWIVRRHDVQATATVNSVRALVQADFNAAPTAVKAVYIVGHVPVPYSGNVNPDGHNEHRGAWPCDGYYGELDGTWTDNSVNSAVSNFPWNHNVPGDGKFDQSDYPSALELQVGRVDFDDMPSFPEGELNMIRAYLAKAHEWKTTEFTVPTTGAVWDDLQWVSNPLGMSGFQSTAACVGLNGIVELEPTSANFLPHYSSTNDLIMYQCGTGLQSPGPGGTVLAGTTDGLSSFDMVSNTRGAVFNMSMGSYFGDWDNSDNFLRAVIARGNGLVHVWSGMPNWYFHPLAMGEPIGYCALRSMNNTNSDYTLQNGGWQGQSLGRVHMGLMGDPTIRMFNVAPPSNLVVTNQQWYSSFTWQASPVVVEGYHVYRIDQTNGTIVRLTSAPVAGTSFVSTEQYIPDVQYMVRAVQLITTASGSYFELSLGALATGSGQVIADCSDVIGGPALPGVPCDDGNAGTIDDVYNANCGCIGLAVGIAEQDLLGTAIWPSPVDGTLFVRSETPSATLLVRSITGALVLTRTMQSDHDQVDTQRLEVGTYFLEIRPKTGSNTVHRFVVKH